VTEAGGWGPFQMIRKARGMVEAAGFELLLVRVTLQGGGGLMPPREQGCYGG
jgi:hypothetical protein